MVHALGAGLEGHAGDGIGGDQSGRLDPQPLGSVAAASGPWDCFDLLPCTDGKARRVEPGTFPLAHGLPGRVGLLRGYGNAIVPEVAATFVWAYLETEREG
jgi:DNA (cytosine-5)-methyltransferase 1